MKVCEIKVYDRFEVFFRLVLCKTRRQMLNAIKKHDYKSGCDNNTIGLFSPTSYITNPDLPGKFRSNVFGTMFLNLSNLQEESGIVVHECGHAAFDFNHYVMRYYGNYSDYENHGEFYFFGGGNSQEAFCYFLENAYKKVWEAIKQFKKEAKNG
jgi:hypothetical protein